MEKNVIFKIHPPLLKQINGNGLSLCIAVSSRLCNVLPLTSTARSRLIHWTLPAFIFPQLAMPGITHKNPNPEAYLFSGLFEEDTSAPYAGGRCIHMYTVHAHLRFQLHLSQCQMPNAEGD